MKYKVGDKVKIKSFDWYDQNKDDNGFVYCGDRIFDDYMSVFCGSVVTICGVCPYGYDIREDMHCITWTDDMIEGLAIEAEPQEKMVSLDKVCDILYDMLHNQWINDGAMVGTWAYYNMEEFIEDFCKRLEE